MSTQVLSHGFGQVPVQRPVKTRSDAPSLTVAIATATMALSVVLADRYLSVWTDGHVVAAWLLMWAVVFGAFVATRTPSRLLAQRVKLMLDGMAARAAERRAERRFEQLAASDPRIMAELQAARARAEEAVAFSAALAPMSMVDESVSPAAKAAAAAAPTELYYRHRNIRLYYI